jgi:hypothetical protein
MRGANRSRATDLRCKPTPEAIAALNAKSAAAA